MNKNNPKTMTKRKQTRKGAGHNCLKQSMISPKFLAIFLLNSNIKIFYFLKLGPIFEGPAPCQFLK